MINLPCLSGCCGYDVSNRRATTPEDYHTKFANEQYGSVGNTRKISPAKNVPVGGMPQTTMHSQSKLPDMGTNRNSHRRVRRLSPANGSSTEASNSSAHIRKNVVRTNVATSGPFRITVNKSGAGLQNTHMANKQRESDEQSIVEHIAKGCTYEVGNDGVSLIWSKRWTTRSTYVPDDGYVEVVGTRHTIYRMDKKVYKNKEEVAKVIADSNAARESVYEVEGVLYPEVQYRAKMDEMGWSKTDYGYERKQRLPEEIRAWVVHGKRFTTKDAYIEYMTSIGCASDDDWKTSYKKDWKTYNEKVGCKNKQNTIDYSNRYTTELLANVTPSMTETQVKEAIKKPYKRLALSLHPDKHPNNRVATEVKFKMLGEAHDAIIKSCDDLTFHLVTT